MLGKKLSTGTKLGYGIGSIGEGLAYNTFYVYFIFFLTDYVGISPAVGGTISLFAVAWDAITDPMIGYLSDRSNSPKGKRRSFILRGFIPLGAILFLMFTSWPGLSGGLQIAYFVIVNTLFWVFFTIVDVPYMTLGGEIATSEEDRLGLRSFGTMGYYLGFLGASSGVILVLEKLAASFNGDYIRAWSIVGLLTGIVTSLTYFICACAVKGKEVQLPKEELVKKEKIGFFQSIKAIFSIKPYLILLGYDFFVNLGIMFFTSCQMYVWNNYIGLTANQIALTYLFYVAFIFICSAIYPKLTKFTDKRNLLGVTLLLSGLGQAAMMILPLNFAGAIFILFCNALAMSGFYVYSYSMLYETSEVSSLKVPEDLDGMFMSAYQFTYKLGTAVSMWLVGIFLTIYEYEATAEVFSEYTINGLRSMASWLPGLMLVLGVPFVFLYKLKSSRVQKLREVVQRKNAGETVDAAEYADL